MLADALTATATRPWHGPAPGPLDPGRTIAAVLFDVDGTLYDQRRLRRLMAAELATLPVWRPFNAVRILRGLQAYRQAQETIRGAQATACSQLERAAESAGLPPSDLQQIVDEWIVERPLKYLQSCRAPGLLDLLTFLSATGVELGVLSDYPMDAKLRALGLEHAFPLRVCATDPEVNVFKPHPRGFQLAAARWGFAPSEILVVGDRAEVDAVGARAAGMRSVIIGREDRSVTATHDDVAFVPSIERLHGVLDGRR